jgi:FkbM family methyltransferase
MTERSLSRITKFYGGFTNAIVIILFLTIVGMSLNSFTYKPPAPSAEAIAEILLRAANLERDIREVMATLKASDNRQRSLLSLQPALLQVSSNATFYRLTTMAGNPFFFPQEDVWHSADYILKHETVARTWMESFMREGCRMIDIGCNGGYYTLASLANGCRVLAVDAQPRCLLRLNSAALLSGFKDRLRSEWSIVSNDPNLNLTVGATRCSGLWSTKDSEWINAESSSTTTVTSKTFQALFEAWGEKTVDLLKVDVEGNELNILESALPYIERREILRIAIEVNPKRVANLGGSSDRWEAVFERVYKAGYVVDTRQPGLATPLHEIKQQFQLGRDSPDIWFIRLQ